MSSVDEVAAVPCLVRHDRAIYRALAGESRQALLAVLHEVGGPPTRPLSAAETIGVVARESRSAACGRSLRSRRSPGWRV